MELLDPTQGTLEGRAVGDHQHLLCCCNTLVLLFHINQGAILTVEGLMQRDIIALLAALATQEAELPDGEGCNVQGGVATLTAGASVFLNGVPAHSRIKVWTPGLRSDFKADSRLHT